MGPFQYRSCVTLCLVFDGVERHRLAIRSPSMDHAFLPALRCSTVSCFNRGGGGGGAHDWCPSKRRKNFYDLHQLRGVMQACEGHFARMFCGGNVVEARGMMLPHRTDETIDLAQFQVSVRQEPPGAWSFGATSSSRSPVRMVRRPCPLI